MSVSVYKTFSSGEILTASDLNSSFTQLTNNGTDMAFPLTKNGAAGGFKLTGLGVGSSDGDSVRFEQLPFHVCNFRLTLTSATPVTTADVTAATTLYASPYKGNAIGLYDGTNWHLRTSAEFSLALGTLSNNTPYDVFCYDNGGTPTLEFLAWTNATTRATALALQNGILCKTGALTRRYLGTFYTTTVATTEDSYANRYVWNYYNRVLRPMRALETSTWNYTTATTRQANGNGANQLAFVIGYSEDLVEGHVSAISNNTNADVERRVTIGLDSTTTGSTSATYTNAGGPIVATSYIQHHASLVTFPGIGRHVYVWQEWSAATGTTTWIGNSSNAYISGIYGWVWA